jgi:hypothetical protein
MVFIIKRVKRKSLQGTKRRRFAVQKVDPFSSVENKKRNYDDELAPCHRLNSTAATTTTTTTTTKHPNSEFKKVYHQRHRNLFQHMYFRRRC